LQLERIGRKIEEHCRHPQDIEWCLVDDTFHIVQSRPITTLYPIPEVNDEENHVYVSVAHQQMMADPIKPLGLSLFQLTSARPMYKAGGRLFVDVTPDLASPVRRTIVVDILGKSDPLIRNALMTILDRGDFIKFLPDDKQEQSSGNSNKGASSLDFQTLTEYDPAIVHDLIERSQTSIDELIYSVMMT
jgi:rifampicin phosphotransferase